MGAVTYPHPDVRSKLSELLICRVNILSAGEDSAVLRVVRPLWAPTLLFLDPQGPELRRLTGFIAPEEFMAELLMVEATSAMLHGDPRRGKEGFAQVATRFQEFEIAAEALYWAGVADYRADPKHAASSLRPCWEELQTRYPRNRWARATRILT